MPIGGNIVNDGVRAPDESRVQNLLAGPDENYNEELDERFNFG